MAYKEATRKTGTIANTNKTFLSKLLVMLRKIKNKLARAGHGWESIVFRPNDTQGIKKKKTHVCPISFTIFTNWLRIY